MLDQLKKISIVSIGNITNALLGITFLAAVTRTLNVEDVGRYAILTTLLVSMSKIIDFGSNSAFVAEALKKDSAVSNSTFITTKLLLFLPAAAIGMLVLKLVGLLELGLGTTFIIGLGAYGINIVLFTFFQKRRMYLKAVLLNTFPAIIKGLFALAVFGGMSINLAGAFRIFAYSMLACGLLAYKVPISKNTLRLNFYGIKELFFTGAPGGIALVIQNSWSTIANTLAKIFRDFSDTGIYAIADKVANIFVLISVSVFTVLLPENAIRKDNKLRYDLKGSGLIVLGIILLAVVTASGGKFLLPIVFGKNFTSSTGILGILIMASAFTAIHTFLDNYFYIEKKTTSLMLINIFKLMIFVSSGIYLIRIQGLTGLAYAQILSSFITLLVTFGYIFHRERFLG